LLLVPEAWVRDVVLLAAAVGLFAWFCRGLSECSGRLARVRDEGPSFVGVEPLRGAPADAVDRGWIVERARHWGDVARWQAYIDAAVAGSDPVVCNLRITLAHQELSLALSQITGPGSGANFHTWAVWGSKTAGRTIRREDLPRRTRDGEMLGGLLAAGAAVGLIGGKVSRAVAVPVLAVAAAGGLISWAAGRLVDRAASAIFGGNATVLEDIGRQTARFLAVFSLAGEDRERGLEDFLAGLRPGPATSSGQDLLRGAYRHYFDASREPDRDRRDELMLCANLLAILHEHQRLQPYIAAAVPRPLGRFVTERLLGFSVGAEAMKVSIDVPTRGPSPFPDTLMTIEDAELEDLLDGPRGWDRTPNTPAGSAAGDWTKLSDRMNFIVDLFRTRQGDPELFTPPYSARQREEILSGRLPDGPL
jgi:hypothetical protein